MYIPIVRLFLTLLTWVAGSYVFHYAHFGAQHLGMGFEMLFIFIAAAVFVITRHIWQYQPKPAAQSPMPAAMAPQLNMRDMMLLLDEDDLDDLRDEARESLRAQIRRLSSDAEIESFETLMSGNHVKRKR